MSSFDDLEVCRGILEGLPTGVCVVDLQKKIVLWSTGAERLTGHLRHEVVGHSCISETLLHCDQPGCEFCNEECPAARAMKTAQPAEGIGLLHHKAGHEIPVRIQAVPVHNQHGSIIGSVETFEEIQNAHAKHQESRVQSAAGLDGVTGIGTRAVTEMYLRQALVSLQEANVPFGLLLLRVQGLQHFRAGFGPDATASLLRAMARSLEGSLWTSDYVGRWSDDQFLVILSGCGAEALPPVRERIRRMLAGESIEWWGERHSLPVSLADAVAEPGDTVDALVGRAQKFLDSVSTSPAQAAAAAGSSGS